MRWPRIACIAAVAGLVCAGTAVAQDSVEQFYRGKTINIIVGGASGGGYDAYGRALGRHMGKYIPGNPAVVVQNMPGAGSNKAASYIYSVAPKDGTAVAGLFPGAVLAPLLTDTAIQHDPKKFIYVGSANSDVYTCVVRTDAPVKSFKDVFTQEVIVGASNQGGTTRDMPTLSNNVLGTRFRIVTGYSGTREITLAVERRETHGLCGFGYTSLNSVRPEWLAKKFVRILVQENAKGAAALNKQGVPRTIDFAKTPEDRQVMELVYSQAVIGRPYVLPEGVPPERVAALRKAFTAALADPALLAEAAKMKLDVEPMSGEDVQAMVTRLFAMPKRIVTRAKQALIYKAPK